VSSHIPDDAFPDILRQRVLAIHEVLFDDTEAAEAQELTASTASLLAAVAGRARALGDSRSAWLLFTALAGALPEPDEVLALRRRLQLSSSAEDAATEALAATRAIASVRGVWNRRIRILRGKTVVDVNFCAKFEHNTGIQRLVRETISRWVSLEKGMDLVAWDHDQITRALHPGEFERVVHWSNPGRNRSEVEEESDVDLIVPIDCDMLFVEVPPEAVCARLAALAEFSGNRVSIVGYDAIPLVSADLVPARESERFARYLAYVKHSDRVFAISAAAAGEFRGFASAVAAQGITGPQVFELSLPVDLPEIWETHDSLAATPLVLSVGSHEPRKNQEAVLFAAGRLWEEGLDFQLVYVGRGDSSLTGPFDRKVARLRKKGHRVEARRSVRDQELSALYHSAYVTIFPSLHEGYGLPVAESLAAGTPVITSDFGSTAEIGADGGCLLVDPRDDDAITNALRRVLTDSKYMDSLRNQIEKRKHRTWADYADGLWNGVQSREAQ
jgi:glycosyltransferase involved in cell wall biosynthesis